MRRRLRADRRAQIGPRSRFRHEKIRRRAQFAARRRGITGNVIRRKLRILALCLDRRGASRVGLCCVRLANCPVHPGHDIPGLEPSGFEAADEQRCRSGLYCLRRALAGAAAMPRSIPKAPRRYPLPGVLRSRRAPAQGRVLRTEGKHLTHCSLALPRVGPTIVRQTPRRSPLRARSILPRLPPVHRKKKSPNRVAVPISSAALPASFIHEGWTVLRIVFGTPASPRACKPTCYGAPRSIRRSKTTGAIQRRSSSSVTRWGVIQPWPSPSG